MSQMNASFSINEHNDNHDVWAAMFDHTMGYGRELVIRGSKVREIINLTLTIDARYPFMSFIERNVNMDYIRRELRWYIKADRYDISIKKYAKIWASMVNDDGSLNSNYGQYWFGSQGGLLKAVHQLEKDKFSRRANIPMIRAEHIEPDVKDSVCTEAINLMIRDDTLHCVVHMRSSDQILGLGNDLPTFSFVQHLAWAILKEAYPDLMIGTLTVTAASSHIYERHFEMASHIAYHPIMFNLYHPKMIEPSTEEALYLCGANSYDLDPEKGELTRWLMDVDYEF